MGVLPSVNRVFFSLMGVVLYSIFLHLSGLDTRLLHQFLSTPPPEAPTPMAIRLNDLILTDHRRIAGIEQNLSGITFCHRNQTLFAVTNHPSRVYAISPSGVCLREIALIGFEDTEGIAFIGGQRFAIVEERRHTVHMVIIDDATTTVNRADALHSLPIPMTSRHNKGLEGIAYDPLRGCLYVAQEKKPRRIRTVDGLLEPRNPHTVRVASDLIPSPWLVHDLSGLHYDPASRLLLLLSDESKCIIAMTLDGRLHEYVSLRKGFGGLQADIPQAEGITLDDRGNLYIVSEPNGFYRFTRRARASEHDLI
jgi:uncharacterized protein YjiK